MMCGLVIAIVHCRRLLLASVIHPPTTRTATPHWAHRHLMRKARAKARRVASCHNTRRAGWIGKPVEQGGRGGAGVGRAHSHKCGLVVTPGMRAGWIGDPMGVGSRRAHSPRCGHELAEWPLFTKIARFIYVFRSKGFQL